ncbi:MAG: hypothetical protein EP314_01405 [Bacteroidetes bacterium]|nr:MAG: hypothetical protein EP314_01405 [Bacteroidota bacterium]
MRFSLGKTYSFSFCITMCSISTAVIGCGRHRTWSRTECELIAE